MSKLTIITHPHATLRRKADLVPVKEIKKHHSFVKDMIETMRDAQGIGLAAPQVDVSKRILVVNTKDGPLALFNAEIKKKSFKKEEAEEGCLSIPGMFGMVKRHASITVKAYNHEAEPVTIEAQGLFARVLQHEIDHINGILFIDRTKKVMTGNDADPSEKI